MLYGSTLNGEDPRDIDMVLLHSGYVLKEFSRYASSKMYDVEPETEADARISSWCIFNQLGYRVDESDSVTKAVGKLIEGLGAGTVTDEEIDEKRREHEECWKPNHRFGEDEEELDLMEGAPEFDAEFDLDIHGISKVFDIHVLNTDLLRNPEDEVLREGVQGRRQGVIDSCGDLTYWYTVLSEGRLYDKRTHDFSILVEDKYPGALELFPSER